MGVNEKNGRRMYIFKQDPFYCVGQGSRQLEQIIRKGVYLGLKEQSQITRFHWIYIERYLIIV